MFASITKSIYRRSLRSLAAGDVEAVLRRFDEGCTLTFVGDTSLGADLAGIDDIRRWFDRFTRLLPQRSFEIRRLAVCGPVWHQTLAAHVTIRGVVAGEPYENQFAHFLALRWGTVTDDFILEDTQTWDRACTRLVRAGVAEAGEPGLVSSGHVAG